MHNLPTPSAADVQRVQAETGMDLLQARNHLIGRELVRRQIEADRAEAARRCLAQWTSRSAS